jgi:hypothetical protein
MPNTTTTKKRRPRSSGVYLSGALRRKASCKGGRKQNSRISRGLAIRTIPSELDHHVQQLYCPKSSTYLQTASMFNATTNMATHLKAEIASDTDLHL